MSPVDEILSQVPIGELAGQLGVPAQVAEAAARNVVPALLGGIQANAADPGGAASLAQAVEQHGPGLIDGGVDLSQINVADGAKIVGNVFGPHEGGVVQQLGGLGAGGQELVQKLLPILAPIVMSYLAKQVLGGGGGLGGVLGGALGGALGGGAPAGQGGGGIGDVLGGVLGNVLGGAPAQQPGAPAPAQPGGVDLGSILGGLLGGGRK